MADLLIEEYIAGADLPAHEMMVKRCKKQGVQRNHWLCDVPLRDSKNTLRISWFEIEIADAAGKITYRNSFVADLSMDTSNIAELANCGRGRWKIENETFNVLKTKGYNLEHNFGCGK